MHLLNIGEATLVLDYKLFELGTYLQLNASKSRIKNFKGIKPQQSSEITIHLFNYCTYLQV